MIEKIRLEVNINFKEHPLNDEYAAVDLATRRTDPLVRSKKHHQQRRDEYVVDKEVDPNDNLVEDIPKSFFSKLRPH